MRTLAVVAVVLWLSSCATPGGSDSRDQVAAATDAWAAAFNSNQPARVTALYDADAVLWGTTSKTIATTPAAIADYFKVITRFPELRVRFGDQNIRVHGDIAINTGYYTFAGPKAELPARYTLVFRRREGKWLIVEHHSSRVP
jgi:uncharacterized protein (TIGR02246 family)